MPRLEPSIKPPPDLDGLNHERSRLAGVALNVYQNACYHNAMHCGDHLQTQIVSLMAGLLHFADRNNVPTGHVITKMSEQYYNHTHKQLF